MATSTPALTDFAEAAARTLQSAEAAATAETVRRNRLVYQQSVPQQ
jgi:hypothetical protein